MKPHSEKVASVANPQFIKFMWLLEVSFAPRCPTCLGMGGPSQAPLTLRFSGGLVAQGGAEGILVARKHKPPFYDR